MEQPTTGTDQGTDQASDQTPASRSCSPGSPWRRRPGQLTQLFYFGSLADPEIGAGIGVGDDQPGEVENALGHGGAGSLLFVTDPAQTNRLQRLALEGSRHGIPLLFGFDVIHGLRTILPVPIALAASWDPPTIERGQAVAAREARAVGIHWTFAPMVDIARDPRWGRIIEGAGEDPFLGAAVAAAQVRGFQGGAIGAPERVIAGPKHWAGYGYGAGGRDYDEVSLSDHDFYNIVLPPFRAALEAGAGNVMTAYMDLNGIPATGNRWLLDDVLRGELGFDGFLVSDANAVRSLLTHGFATDLTDAAARALAVGLDLEMAVSDPAYAHLPEAVAAGLVDEAALDVCVRRVLATKLRLGLFEDPYVDEARAARGAVRPRPPRRRPARRRAHRRPAAQRGRRSCRSTRPRSARSPCSARWPTRGATRSDRGSSTTTTTRPSRSSRGCATGSGAGVTVDFAPGVRPGQRTFPSMFDMWGDNAPVDPTDFDDEAELQAAVDLAASADVAVVVVGEWQNMVGEAASRSSLELPGRQLELLQAVVATGTPTVAVVMNGRPLDLRWAAAHVPAILDVWYPGSQGGTAVANLLVGDAVPGGKLPFTWPRTVGQVPMFYAHTVSHEPDNQGRRYWDEESTPLFPFGHGLSYATFSYADLVLGSTSVGLEGSVSVVGRRHQHRRPRRRGGRPALPAPAPRPGLAPGPRAEGVRAGGGRRGADADRDVRGGARPPPLLERRRTRLGPRPLDLRRLGRHQLHGRPDGHLRGHRLTLPPLPLPGSGRSGARRAPLSAARG